MIIVNEIGVFCFDLGFFLGFDLGFSLGDMIVVLSVSATALRNREAVDETGGGGGLGKGRCRRGLPTTTLLRWFLLLCIRFLLLLPLSVPKLGILGFCYLLVDYQIVNWGY